MTEPAAARAVRHDLPRFPPSGPRTDHEVRLNQGDTVVLITDGLVQADRSEIDAGVARLAGAIAESDGLGVEQLCDRLLERIVPGPPTTTSPCS